MYFPRMKLCNISFYSGFITFIYFSIVSHSHASKRQIYLTLIKSSSTCVRLNCDQAFHSKVAFFGFNLLNRNAINFLFLSLLMMSLRLPNSVQSLLCRYLISVGLSNIKESINRTAQQFVLVS